MSEPMSNPYQVTRTQVDDLAPAEDRGDKPNTVSVAVVMLWITLIIQLAGLVWIWQFARHGPALIFIGMSVVSAIWLFTAYLVAMVEKGRNWARITYLVLFLLGLPFIVMSLKTANWRLEPVAALSAVTQTVLQAIAMVLVFIPASRRWYRGS